MTTRITYPSISQIIQAIDEAQQGARTRLIDDPEEAATTLAREIRRAVRLARQWGFSDDRASAHVSTSPAPSSWKYPAMGTVASIYWSTDQDRYVVGATRHDMRDYYAPSASRVDIQGTWATGPGRRDRIAERERGRRQSSRPRWGIRYAYPRDSVTP